MTTQILLAEDNRADVVLVREALAAHHIEHELYVVTDGAEAISFVTRMGKEGEPPCPDILLLDLNLPKADGIEILARFRQHPECTLTPVIIVTSSDMPREREKVAAFGVSAYFRKPLDLEGFMRLGAVVKEVLERTAAVRSGDKLRPSSQPAS